MQGSGSAEAMQASHPKLEALGLKQDSAPPMHPIDPQELGSLLFQGCTKEVPAREPLLRALCGGLVMTEVPRVVQDVCRYLQAVIETPRPS